MTEPAMAICAACGQENPEVARFCLACGTPIAAEPLQQREVRKTVTVVFSDVSGSTALGERLDAEAVRGVMERYFAEMRAVLERHGGTVEKFIGDAVMAVFGVPVSHEDDALRAVRAAVEMRERLGELNERLAADWNVTIGARTGVNTGEVVTGDGHSRERLATGDAVNVAARLEQAAAPGEILIGVDTYRLVKHAVEAEPVEPLAVKGKSEPLGAFSVRAVADVSLPTRALDSPLVGRERELRRLRDTFEQAAADRSCHLFTLLGPAGVGKSRLVRELADELQGRATVVRGRCLPYGEGITYWPVVEAVRDAAGLVESSSPADAQGRVAAVLGDDPQAAAVAERVLEVLRAGEGAGAADETFWALRKFLETLARARPLVVVFDDVHWGEPTFLDLVEHVADWSRDAAILLVCVARPELLDVRPGWGGGKLNATSLLLEPLDDEHSAQLIESLLGETDLVEDLQRRIGEAAEGNPLFVEEMLAVLIEDGVLERRNGGWTAVRDLERISVPPTIQALLGARLDQLAGEQRAVLERASIEGQVFHARAVAELVPEELRPRVVEHLSALVRKELVRPEASSVSGEDAFRFRHLLIREAAYEALPKKLRADLHERFAGWLGRRTDWLAESDELVGYHLEQAFRYRAELGPVDGAGREIGVRAARRLAAAARAAAIRGDRFGSTNLHARAAALVLDDDPRKLEFLPDLAHALGTTGQLAEMKRVIDDIDVRARRAGDETALAGVSLLRLLYGYRTGAGPGDDHARRQIERSVEVFSRAGDELHLARAFLALAWTESGAHRTAAARRAADHARRAGGREEEMYAHSYAVGGLVEGPTPVAEAIAECESLLVHSKPLRTKESAHVALARLSALRGDFAAAAEHMRRRSAVVEELGVSPAVGVEAITLGWIELVSGDLEAATTQLQTAVRELRDYSLRSVVALAHALLARALSEGGRPGDAATLPLDDDATVWLEGRARFEVHAARALVRARSGDARAADPIARQALALVSGGHVLLLEAQAHADLAEILVRAGRIDEGRGALAESLRLFAAKGATAAAARAERQIEALAPQAEARLS